MTDSTPETSRTRSDAGTEGNGSGPADDVVGEAEVYINEDDAPRRWRKAPVVHGPEWYAGRARTYFLLSAVLVLVHSALTVIDIIRAG